MSRRSPQKSAGIQAVKKNRKHRLLFYSVSDITDAVEHHEYSRAMGLLTWGTWDTAERPFEERLKDFLHAYPPNAPACFQGTMLTRTSEGEYGPASEAARLTRVRASDNSFGTLVDALARYGLKLNSGPLYRPHQINVSPFLQITRIRNQRLRKIHGGVDI